jgi:hypothetical protein
MVYQKGHHAEDTASLPRLLPRAERRTAARCAATAAGGRASAPATRAARALRMTRLLQPHRSAEYACMLETCNPAESEAPCWQLRRAVTVAVARGGGTRCQGPTFGTAARTPGEWTALRPCSDQLGSADAFSCSVLQGTGAWAR